MFIVVIFIPVVAGDLLLESNFHRFPEITERKGDTKTYGIFDPCNLKKPGDRNVSCAQLKRKGEHMNAVYDINPHDKGQVQCDMETDGGGWTVIQRRGTAEQLKKNIFQTTEEEYKKGFGDVGASYWIGNDNLHLLTTFPNNRQVLKIELTTEEGNTTTMSYGIFEVGSNEQKYKLTIGNYSGPPGYNALKSYDGAEFFIGKRHFNDPRKDCYPPLSGGWWYSPCVKSNLNGRRFKPYDKTYDRSTAIIWSKDGDDKSYDAVYRLVEMKIRDADFDFCTGNMAK